MHAGVSANVGGKVKLRYITFSGLHNTRLLNRYCTRCVELETDNS